MSGRTPDALLCLRGRHSALELAAVLPHKGVHGKGSSFAQGADGVPDHLLAKRLFIRKVEKRGVDVSVRKSTCGCTWSMNCSACIKGWPTNAERVFVQAECVCVRACVRACMCGREGESRSTASQLQTRGIHRTRS